MLCQKLRKNTNSSSVDRVELFQCINVDSCNLFSVFRSATFDSRFHTKFCRVKRQIDEVMHEIAQNFDKLVFGES